MSDRPYSRVYHRLMTEYPTVWRSQAQLGMYVQMLVMAEKFYPECPPAPRKDRVYRALVESGLVIEQGNASTYTVLGLAAERERRAAQGRSGGIANAMRTRSERGTTDLRDETRRDETRQEGGNGQSPTTFMRYPERKPQYQPAPGEAARLVHDGKHRDADRCGVCHPLPREAVGE